MSQTNDSSHTAQCIRDLFGPMLLQTQLSVLIAGAVIMVEWNGMKCRSTTLIGPCSCRGFVGAGSERL